MFTVPTDTRAIGRKGQFACLLTNLYVILCVTVLHCVRVDLWVCFQFALCYIAWEMNAVRHQSPVLVSVNEIVQPK